MKALYGCLLLKHLLQLILGLVFQEVLSHFLKGFQLEDADKQIFLQDTGIAKRMNVLKISFVNKTSDL